MINAYRFFAIYKALDMHFTSKYDILKYGGKSSNISLDRFTSRKDRLRFEKFARNINNEKDAYDFCVSNFIHCDDKWFYHDYASADKVYVSYKGYFEALKYNFAAEMKVLENYKKEYEINFKDMLVATKSGNQPPLLQLFLHAKFSAYFICILDSYYKFLNVWYEQARGVDPFVEKQLFVLTKFAPLCILKSKECS